MENLPKSLTEKTNIKSHSVNFQQNLCVQKSKVKYVREK